MFFTMERDEKELCTVLSTGRQGERDRMLFLLSPSLGLIKARVYGAQKSAKSIKAPLFSEGVFSLYKDTRNNISLKDVDIINLRDEISTDMDKTVSASLIAELCMNAKAYDEQLYAIAAKNLDALCLDISYKRVVIAFIIKYLSHMGSFGDYECCPICQKVYSNDEVLGYNSQIGASCCQNCSQGEGNLLLPPNARAFIREAIKADNTAVFSFKISEVQEDRIFRFLLRLLKATSLFEIKTLSSGIWRLI